MPFKVGNPGCACCSCGCYPFDNSAVDYNGALDLTATSASYDASVKKLGTHSASFNATPHYEHPHHACFTPAIGNTMRVWFWLRTSNSGTPDPTKGFAGVVTKGEVNFAYGSPPTITLTGEWGVFHRPATASGPELQFVYKSTTVNLGVMASIGLLLNKWYFFHLEINRVASTYAVHSYNSTDGNALPTYSGSLSGTLVAQPTVPMRIGKNSAPTGELLGYNGGSFWLDNVGFSKEAGSVSTLYNSGSGQACPATG